MGFRSQGSTLSPSGVSPDSLAVLDPLSAASDPQRPQSSTQSGAFDALKVPPKDSSSSEKSLGADPELRFTLLSCERLRTDFIDQVLQSEDASLAEALSFEQSSVRSALSALQSVHRCLEGQFLESAAAFLSVFENHIHLLISDSSSREPLLRSCEELREACINLSDKNRSYA